MTWKTERVWTRSEMSSKGPFEIAMEIAAEHDRLRIAGVKSMSRFIGAEDKYELWSWVEDEGYKE
jgi:hypothetical protein